jgi:two-component system nitrogen regulation response regulator NtrX
MTLILIVEDDEQISGSLVLRLREAGHGATAVRSGEDALRWLRDANNVEPDLLLVDVRLPGISGIELLRRLKADGALPQTLVISGEASMSETIEAIGLGVHDFLDKPFTRERLLKSIANGIEHAALRRQLAALRAGSDSDPQILGDSASVRALRAAIEKVAATEARVLIRGESGTGKELVANALHRLSRRSGRAFVKLNCAAIPPHLIEDELFGHARGAFTDAKTAKRGLFEEADGGTLFLDEIGDMDLMLQSRLLRVLEDGRVRRIGETTDRSVSVRVISATHRDLDALAKSGGFREDLFFRLATVPIDVPPLRERRDDIPLLFANFFADSCRRNRRPPMTIDVDALEALRGYDWPGNVRELRNVAERLSVFATDPVTPDQLPIAILTRNDAVETGMLVLPESAEIIPLREFKTRCEKEYIERVLRRTDWNVSRAAELLDMQRTHLHQKMSALGIERPQKSEPGFPGSLE